jgi:GNAT superfamily N-acetyltransferase
MSGTLLHLTTRPATAADQPLLQRLFAVGCAPDLSALQLTPELLDQIIGMQYRAREVSYAASAQNATDHILTLADGTAVGRHLLDLRSDSIRTIDIAVLPEFRKQRIGAWALHEAQLQAARLGLPYRLSVRNTNPARRLYLRQGFSVIAQDDISAEMEWRFTPVPGHLTTQQMLDRIVPFLREIGFAVEFGSVPSNSFLPGIHLIQNGLRIERERLLHPGDLLHEAGHLAVMPPEARHLDGPEPTDAGEELAATAWSYAAALHLGIPVTQVIHDYGYRNSAAGIREVLATGEGFGVPLLSWMGLSRHSYNGDPGLYPAMLRWVREHRLPEESVSAPTHAATSPRFIPAEALAYA